MSLTVGYLKNRFEYILVVRLSKIYSGTTERYVHRLSVIQRSLRSTSVEVRSTFGLHIQ